MQHTPCRVRHLVKLINTTYATITQDECTTGRRDELRIKLMDKLSLLPLEHKLFRIWIPGNISRQADSRRSLSGRVNASRCKFVYILLCGTGSGQTKPKMGGRGEEALACNI